MFSRILVANRGEIALRVIRTCRRLGIETVAVYSEADENAVYLRLADRSFRIGPPSSAKSYLSIPNIIAAAEVADVEAVHPGYGFLAENVRFADICRSCQIAFIGPPVKAMEMVGDKVRARQCAMEAKVPVVPGSDGPVEDENAALEVSRKIGYPVMVKAAAGGGGRGIRLVRNDAALHLGFAAAKAEAEAAFGDGRLYVEKYIERPRHVEVQILADAHGNMVHLGERDCTVQRRHQKLIEESPSPAVDKRLRGEMGKAAIRLMQKVGYTNAGTVEFLLDRDGKFYFMEVNARIQVEHPVTEAVTGIDIVEAQIRIAAGEPLGLRQKDIRIDGWAIECRINAEDPEDGFTPRPGKIALFCPPAGRGIRVDSHAYSGYEVPPYYDSMVAKLIVHGADRADAIRRTRLALADFILEGIPNTINFCRDVLAHARFVRGEHDTNFVEEALARR